MTTARYLAYLVGLLLLLATMSCNQVSGPQPSPVVLTVPDTIITPMGPIPIVTVDTIAGPMEGGLAIGRYSFLDRTIYLWRGVKDPVARLKVIRHEQCHAVLTETGLQRHVPDELTELICDALAASLVASDQHRP